VDQQELQRVRFIRSWGKKIVGVLASKKFDKCSLGKGLEPKCVLVKKRGRDIIDKKTGSRWFRGGVELGGRGVQLTKASCSCGVECRIQVRSGEKRVRRGEIGQRSGKKVVWLERKANERKKVSGGMPSENVRVRRQKYG